MLYWQDIKGFGKNIQKSGRPGCLLCFDWGKKNCGVAISDHNFSVAMPVGIIFPDLLLDKVVYFNKERGIAGVVVGLPITKDFCGIHEHGKQVIELGKRICDETGIPVLLWDERMSTVGSFHLRYGQNVINKRLANNSRTRTVDKHIGGFKPGQRNDDLAAHFILDGLLDALRPFVC